MTQDKKTQLPIGYWLKQADNLLTEQINKAQAANGLGRSDWQVLNMLKESGGADKTQIFELMQTFVDESGLNEILSRLTMRGWVEAQSLSKGGQEFRLTEQGRQQHELVFARQKEVRQRAMQGISEQEYATVVQVLQRIVANLSEGSVPAS